MYNIIYIYMCMICVMPICINVALDCLHSRAVASAFQLHSLGAVSCFSRGSFVLRPPPSSPSRRRRQSLRFRSPLPALLGCSLVSDVASLASFLSSHCLPCALDASQPGGSLVSCRLLLSLHLFLGLCFATAEAAHRVFPPLSGLAAVLSMMLLRLLGSFRGPCLLCALDASRPRSV